MMTRKKDLFLLPIEIGICLIVAVCSLITGCVAPVFSDFQSARTVGTDHSEITPSYSSVFCWYRDYGSQLDYNQSNVGLQFAVGLADICDLRLRYECLITNNPIHYFSSGLKFRIVKNKVAVFMPIVIYYIPYDNSLIFHFVPTALFTIPLSNKTPEHFEINPSVKALIPFASDQETRVMFSVNLGGGLSTDLSKWAIRPEAGLLFYQDSPNPFVQFSLGFTFYH
jgi:hypothetical protein